MSKVVLNRVSAAPGLPTAGKVAVYLDTDNLVKAKTDDGSVYTLDVAARGPEYFRQVGVSPLEIWHGLGVVNEATRTVTPAKDILFAQPFFSGRGGTIDRLAVQVATAGTITSGTGKARLGIYANTSDTVLYPAALLIDAGEVVITAAGVKSLTISQALPRLSLLWAIFTHDCDLASPVMKSIASYATEGILGYISTNFDPGMTHLRKAAVYAALPDPFPAAATVSGGDPILSAVRYSA